MSNFRANTALGIFSSWTLETCLWSPNLGARPALCLLVLSRLLVVADRAAPLHVAAGLSLEMMLSRLDEIDKCLFEPAALLAN